MGRAAEIKRVAGDAIRESLGRGASSPATLKIAQAPATAASPDDAGIERERKAIHIPLSRIDRDPNQPRKEFDEGGLQDLANAFRVRGQLQACRVIEIGDRYQLVCGERRWRAAAIAGLPRLLCIVVDANQVEIEREADQLVENAGREDLSPADFSRAIRRQLDVRGCSQHELAKILGISQTRINHALSFETLPEPIKEAVQTGGLSASSAVEISKLPDTDQQLEVARQAVQQKLTRDEIRSVVKTHRDAVTSPVREGSTSGKAGGSSGAVVPISGESRPAGGDYTFADLGIEDLPLDFTPFCGDAAKAKPSALAKAMVKVRGFDYLCVGASYQHHERQSISLRSMVGWAAWYPKRITSYETNPSGGEKLTGVKVTIGQESWVLGPGKDELQVWRSLPDHLKNPPAVNPWKAGVRVRLVESRGKGNGEFGTVAKDWNPEDGRIEVIVEFRDGNLLGYCDPDELEIVDRDVKTKRPAAAPKEIPAVYSWGCDLLNGASISVMNAEDIIDALYAAADEYRKQQKAAEKPKSPKA